MFVDPLLWFLFHSSPKPSPSHVYGQEPELNFKIQTEIKLLIWQSRVLVNWDESIEGEKSFTRVKAFFATQLRGEF